MKKLFVAILMVSFLLSAGTVMAEGVSVMGTVQQVEDQFVLVTDDNTQFILEEVDLSAHIDKKVTIVGELTEDGEKKMVKVVSYEPAE
jgi:hypothetical protein